jgi:hypothetical protein
VTEPSASDEGLLHLLPIQLDRTIVSDTMVSSQLPWGAPNLVCLGGTDASETPVLSIAYEWPVPWLRATQPLSKAELELIHLQRFRIDHLAALGTVPFGNVQEGSNPPDFVVVTADGPVNLDCAAIIALFWVIFLTFTMSVARSKGHSPLLWGFAGRFPPGDHADRRAVASQPGGRLTGV